MNARLLLAIACVGLLAPRADAWTPCLLDPVTTFTNGMALPNSDPMRSHNVYWQCDPYHRGCCGGHYNCPCVAFGLFPNKCGYGSCNGYAAPVLPGGHRTGSYEGVEANGVVILGNLPAPKSAALGPGAP